MLARLGSADDRRGLVPSLAIFGVLFPLLAGARLLPVLRYLREHPRLVPLDDQMTLGEVLRTWTLRMHERAFAGHPYVWDEFADYVGIIPVALLLAGILVAVFRRDGEIAPAAHRSRCCSPGWSGARSATSRARRRSACCTSCRSTRRCASPRASWARPWSGSRWS